MIQFTATQLNGWTAMYRWPLVRVLAFIAIAPPLANIKIPMSIKVMFGAVIMAVLTPVLPVPVGVSVGPYEGLWITLAQMLIKLVLGFCVQLVFPTIGGAGEMMSVQMGLGFVSLLDPTQTENSMLLGHSLSPTAVTTLTAGDGHLVLPHALFDSFAALLVSTAPLNNSGQQTLVGGDTIALALAPRTALPIIVVMVIVDLGFTVFSCTAQAFNPFVVGIVATLAVGLMSVMMMMTPLASVVEQPVMDVPDLGGRVSSRFNILPRQAVRAAAALSAAYAMIAVFRRPISKGISSHEPPRSCDGCQPRH